LLEADSLSVGPEVARVDIHLATHVLAVLALGELVLGTARRPNILLHRDPRALPGLLVDALRPETIADQDQVGLVREGRSDGPSDFADHISIFVDDLLSNGLPLLDAGIVRCRQHSASERWQRGVVAADAFDHLFLELLPFGI